MKRSPLTHGRVFDDEAFAERYAERHQKMAEGFGHECAEKLVSRGFYEGRIIDVGCGFGAMNIVLARRFIDSEIVGIDLSDPLLRLANQYAQAAGLGDRVRFEKADVHQIPYDDAAFERGDKKVRESLEKMMATPRVDEEVFAAMDRLAEAEGAGPIIEKHLSKVGEDPELGKLADEFVLSLLETCGDPTK